MIAVPASAVETIGANIETPSAASMTIPIPGITLISNDEKRMARNESQTTPQIARHAIDAVRNAALFTSAIRRRVCAHSRQRLSVRVA